MRFVVIALAAAVLSTAARAQDSEQGWGMFFKKDTFDQTVFPVGMMAESGEAFGQNNIGVACGGDGGLVPFFTQALPSFGQKPLEIAFRSGGKVQSYTFEVRKVPHLSSQYALKGSDADHFLAMFADASGPISYKMESKQGQFPSVAAKQVIAIVKAHCGNGGG